MTVKENTFLPKKKFYLCANNEEYNNLPLPLKCSTWFKKDFGRVKSVIFDVWFDEYKTKGKVYIHPQDVFKTLFISGNSINLYSVVSVVIDNGVKTFETYAKWVQDTKTGCYAIVSNNGDAYGKQGGFNEFLPENCYVDEEGNWKLNSCIKSENISYVSF